MKKEVLAASVVLVVVGGFIWNQQEKINKKGVEEMIIENEHKTHEKIKAKVVKIDTNEVVLELTEKEKKEKMTISSVEKERWFFFKGLKVEDIVTIHYGKKKKEILYVEKIN